MTNDDLRGIAEALAQMDRVQELLSVQVQEGEGQDDAKIVTAKVDSDQRLLSLTVATKWQERVEPEELSAAAKQAIGRAIAESIGASEDEDESGDDTQTGQADAGPSGAPEQAAEREAQAEAYMKEQQERFLASIPSSQEALEDMMEQIHRGLAMVEELSRSVTEQQQSVTRTEYFNSTRRASIVYEAGFPVEVNVDRNWVKNQSGMTLTTVFTEILEQAAQQRHALPLGDEKLKAFGL